jgi:hypothetical protein
MNTVVTHDRHVPGMLVFWGGGQYVSLVVSIVNHIDRSTITWLSIDEGRISLMRMDNVKNVAGLMVLFP